MVAPKKEKFKYQCLSESSLEKLSKTETVFCKPTIIDQCTHMHVSVSKIVETRQLMHGYNIISWKATYIEYQEKYR